MAKIVPKPPKALPPGTELVEVTRGDSMKKIAKRRGISLDGFIHLNPQVKDPGRIYAGQQLVAPQRERTFSADDLETRMQAAKAALVEENFPVARSEYRRIIEAAQKLPAEQRLPLLRRALWNASQVEQRAGDPRAAIAQMDGLVALEAPAADVLLRSAELRYELAEALRSSAAEKVFVDAGRLRVQSPALGAYDEAQKILARATAAPSAADWTEQTQTLRQLVAMRRVAFCGELKEHAVGAILQREKDAKIKKGELDPNSELGKHRFAPQPTRLTKALTDQQPMALKDEVWVGAWTNWLIAESGANTVSATR